MTQNVSSIPTYFRERSLAASREVWIMGEPSAEKAEAEVARVQRLTNGEQTPVVRFFQPDNLAVVSDEMMARAQADFDRQRTIAARSDLSVEERSRILSDLTQANMAGGDPVEYRAAWVKVQAAHRDSYTAQPASEASKAAAWEFQKRFDAEMWAHTQSDLRERMAAEARLNDEAQVLGLADSGFAAALLEVRQERAEARERGIAMLEAAAPPVRAARAEVEQAAEMDEGDGLATLGDLPDAAQDAVYVLAKSLKRIKENLVGALYERNPIFSSEAFAKTVRTWMGEGRGDSYLRGHETMRQGYESNAIEMASALQYMTDLDASLVVRRDEEDGPVISDGFTWDLDGARIAVEASLLFANVETPDGAVRRLSLAAIGRDRTLGDYQYATFGYAASVRYD